MNRLLTAVIAAGGSLALAGGVLAAAATPAAAGQPPGGGNSSYGASAPVGPVTAVPQALAQQTGPELRFVSNVDISGLLSTGLTLDTASSIAAFSRVTSVNAGFSFAGQTVSLVAKQVSSTCRSNPQTASANLISGVLTVNGTVINLPNHPTAGETFTSGGVTVTLNNQLTVTGISIEDQAVHIHIAGGSDHDGTPAAQDLYIGVSVCNNPGTGSNTITITPPGNQTSTSGTAITPLTISASDSDTGQTLTYSATGLPGNLSIDPTTGVISGTPPHAGTFSVTVTARDTTGASGSASFTWTVNNVVTVSNPGDQTSSVGSSPSLTMSATDSDSNITHFIWSESGQPTGLSINPDTGVIHGTPTVPGTFTVTVTANDGTGAHGSTTFTWTITGP
jgi:hypothetical protein